MHSLGGRPSYAAATMRVALHCLPIILVATLATAIDAENEFREHFSKSVCNFAVALFKKVSVGEGNAIISPISISMVLSMLQQGAGGETAEELERVLGLSADSARDGYSHLMKTFEKPGNVTLTYANKIYLTAGKEMHPNFELSVKENFHADWEEVDFATRTVEDFVDYVNKWIMEATRGQIKDLIQMNMIRTDMSMLLLNAVYFKGNWNTRFKEKFTKIDTFEKSSTETVKASFMYQRNRFYAGRNATLGVKWIEVPYEGNTHKIIFILPLKNHNLEEVTGKLTGENLKYMMKYSDISEVRLKVPKFVITKTYHLVEPLEEVGLKHVFTELSNYGRMTAVPVYPEDVIHRAKVEIDEKGSTASAATAMILLRKSLLKTSFRLDQPFLFFIIDSAYEIPVFAGKVTDPNNSG